MADEGAIQVERFWQGRQGQTEHDLVGVTLTVAGGKMPLLDVVTADSSLTLPYDARLVELRVAKAFTNHNILIRTLKDRAETGDVYAGDALSPALNSPHIYPSKYFPAGIKIRMTAFQLA